MFGRLLIKLKNSLLILFTLLTFASCNTTKDLTLNNSRTNQTSIAKYDNKTRNAEWKILAEKGISKLKQDKLEEASKFFNLALKLNISNSYLQFLNGYTYHLIALNQNGTKYNLAEEGYKLAIKFDESNWIARYQLGLLYLDQKNFKNAKVSFANALMYEDSDTNLLQNFIYASYFSKDPVSASAATKRLCELEGHSKRCLKNQIILNASLGEEKEIKKFSSIYKKNFPSSKSFSFLQKRIRSWDLFHREFKKVI